MELAAQALKRTCALGLLAGLACVGLTGCVLTGSKKSESIPAPKGTASQIVVRWNNQPGEAPDPARGGIPAPGLVGRMYVFGPDLGFPLKAEGDLIVALFDRSTLTPEGDMKQLEEWRIDSATLQRLGRKDTCGWGYSLFLPWGTYRPDLVNLHLKVCLRPKNGAPLYTHSDVRLQSEGPVITASRQTVSGPDLVASKKAPPKPAAATAPPPPPRPEPIVPTGFTPVRKE